MTPRHPEAKARREIDDALAPSGWAVQDYEDMNLSAARGVAVREFVMASGHGFADYLLLLGPSFSKSHNAMRGWPHRRVEKLAVNRCGSSPPPGVLLEVLSGVRP